MSVTAASPNLRLIAASLCGGTGVLMGILSNSPLYTSKFDLPVQKAFCVSNQYHVVHALATALLALLLPTSEEAIRASPALSALSKAYCCFASGTVVLTVTKYTAALGAGRRAWLHSLSQLGGLVVALGWGYVAVAGIKSA